MVVREVVPGRAVLAVVLAHRAPGPLGQVGTPGPPRLRRRRRPARSRARSASPRSLASAHCPRRRCYAAGSSPHRSLSPRRVTAAHPDGQLMIPIRLRPAGLRRPRRGRHAASGWSPTASAATPWARSAACAPAATTACWSSPGDTPAARGTLALAALDPVVTLPSGAPGAAGHPRVGRRHRRTRAGIELRALRPGRRAAPLALAGRRRGARARAGDARTAGPASRVVHRLLAGGAGRAGAGRAVHLAGRARRAARAGGPTAAVDAVGRRVRGRGRLPAGRPGLASRPARWWRGRAPPRGGGPRPDRRPRTSGTPAGSPRRCRAGRRAGGDRLGRRPGRRRRRRPTEVVAAARAPGPRGRRGRRAGRRRRRARSPWPPTRSSCAPPPGPDVVAGYPWFGAWSRDTMISYEGLFLRHRPRRRGPRAAARRTRRRCPRGCSPTPPTPGAPSTTPPTRRCGSCTRSSGT